MPSQERERHTDPVMPALGGGTGAGDLPSPMPNVGRDTLSASGPQQRDALRAWFAELNCACATETTFGCELGDWDCLAERWLAYGDRDAQCGCASPDKFIDAGQLTIRFADGTVAEGWLSGDAARRVGQMSGLTSISFADRGKTP